MKSKAIVFFLLMAISNITNAQLYFPPTNSTQWDTISPSRLGWCEPKIDSLYNFLENNNTKAFILLKDGKIVLEQYFNGHTSTSNWYWASAGKTLTAFMVGIAQQENFLDITDTASKYLGQGWTTCTSSQEEKITIWNQLTMTSGLNDAVDDPFCTIDTCLEYLADAGTRWAYHNAPYTLLDDVLENAINQPLNAYINQKVKISTGMDGQFIQQGFNNIFISTARSMSRFGLLMLNNGNWNGTPIMTDSNYFNQMVNTSQNINESYGYLCWLNGKNSYMIPQLQFAFNGSMNPNAPNDMYAAIGKNGQFLNVVPSQNMVWIRMGDAPDNSLVPFTLNDDIWRYINDLNCDVTTSVETKQAAITAYPNPVNDYIYINTSTNISSLNFELINNLGKVILAGKWNNQLSIANLPSGVYFLKVTNIEINKTFKLIKQ